MRRNFVFKRRNACCLIFTLEKVCLLNTECGQCVGSVSLPLVEVLTRENFLVSVMGSGTLLKPPKGVTKKRFSQV